MLGGLRIRLAGGPWVELSPHYPNALLACLALQPDTIHVREELIERLWPDEDLERAQQRLRRSLHLLRRLLQQPPFERDDLLKLPRAGIGLNAGVVSTDVA